MNHKKQIKKDLLIIFASVAVGIFLLKTQIVESLLFHSSGWEYFGIFLAGMFFTSVFTTVPSTIALGELALDTGLPELIIIGGLGALCGDLIIFRFFKNNILDDLNYLFRLNGKNRWKHLFKSRIFKFFLSLVGGIIIASPLPDELGLAFMGLSKTNNYTFALVSIVCNCAGILFIALVARAMVF